MTVFDSSLKSRNYRANYTRKLLVGIEYKCSCHIYEPRGVWLEQGAAIWITAPWLEYMLVWGESISLFSYSFFYIVFILMINHIYFIKLYAYGTYRHWWTAGNSQRNIPSTILLKYEYINIDINICNLIKVTV